MITGCVDAEGTNFVLIWDDDNKPHLPLFTDIDEFKVDVFVMGDDWKGKFDFVKETGAEVVYLERTPEISTSQIKKDLNDKKI